MTAGGCQTSLATAPILTLVVFHLHVVALAGFKRDFACNSGRRVFGPVFSDQFAIEIDAHAIIGNRAEAVLSRDSRRMSLPVQRAEKLSAGMLGAGFPIPQSKFTIPIDSR